MLPYVFGLKLLSILIQKAWCGGYVANILLYKYCNRTILALIITRVHLKKKLCIKQITDYDISSMLMMNCRFF